MDWISVTETKFMIVMEAKGSTREAMKQCLLAMKDARNNDSEGVVYGFVTTEEHWQMLKYDGTSFQKSRKITVVFDDMDEGKEAWMKECSVFVDCMVVALSNGGIVKDVVA